MKSADSDSSGRLFTLHRWKVSSEQADTDYCISKSLPDHMINDFGPNHDKVTYDAKRNTHQPPVEQIAHKDRTDQCKQLGVFISWRRNNVDYFHIQNVPDGDNEI